jgi:hypothetical protein
MAGRVEKSQHGIREIADAAFHGDQQGVDSRLVVRLIRGTARIALQQSHSTLPGWK